MLSRDHTFNVEFAEKYGMVEALLFRSLEMWIGHNKRNKKNYKHGRTWTFNSWEAWKEQYPYLKEYTIRKAMKHLEEEKIIEIRNGMNEKNKWDKTNWFTILEENVMKGEINMMIVNKTEIRKGSGSIANKMLSQENYITKDSKGNYYDKEGNWISEEILEKMKINKI